MAEFGGGSLKRTVLWANSRALRMFLTRGLTKAEMQKKKKSNLVKKSIGKSGKPQFTGNPAMLKKSQPQTQLICNLKSCVFDRSLTHLQPRKYPAGFALRVVRAREQLLAEKELPTVQREAGSSFSELSKAHDLVFCQDLNSRNLIASDFLAPELFNDCWEDARMPSVVAYMRGSRYLNLPESLRRLLPRELPLAPQ